MNKIKDLLINEIKKVSDEEIECSKPIFLNNHCLFNIIINNKDFRLTYKSKYQLKGEK